MKPRIALITTATLALTLVNGCGVFGPQQQESVSYEVTGVTVAVDIETGPGKVEIVASERTVVNVTENLSWRGGKPATSHPVTNGKLLLRYDCPTGINTSCKVGYRVEVPRNTEVWVDAGSGDIQLAGITTGNVKLTTGSGDIRGSGLGPAAFQIEAGSGDVELDFVDVPTEVRVETGSGDVTARLPRASYAVRTDTGSGEEKIEVVRDPEALHRFTVKTGSGDITIVSK